MPIPNALKSERQFAFSPEPMLGEIYRDARDCSFIVLRVDPEDVFIEYADGTTRTVSTMAWHQMVARAAAC